MQLIPIAPATRPQADSYPEPVQIELTATFDDEIGAVPPLDDGVWQVVRSGGGRTLWRCIRMNNTCATGTPPQDATS